MTATVGITGLVAAPATDSLTASQSGRDLYKLLTTGVGPYSATLTQDAPSFDSTAFGSSGIVSKTNRVGLRTWSGTIGARFPRALAKHGINGLVTFSGGYVVNAYAWNLNIAVDEFEVTGFASTAPTDAVWVPGAISWSGGWEAYIDSSTALTNAAAHTATAGAATFRLTDETNDNILSGTIFANQLQTSTEVGGVNTATYSFVGSGDLSTDGTGSIIPVSSAGTPEVIGTPDLTEIVVTHASGKTATGFCFWNSLNIRCAKDGMIDVQIGIRGSGALTLA